MIPQVRPDLGAEEIEAVTDVLRSGHLGEGRRVAQLEARWAAFVGVRHAVAIANGTASLMAIYTGLGLGPGDEVVTVGHAANSTVSSILFTGAAPVFVDIEPDTQLIDAKLISGAITSRTRAICPVHLNGLPADMEMICAIADRYGVAVVEDAFAAHGARFRGRRVGSFGHAAFSLDSSRHVVTGEGGLVTTNDDRLAAWLRMFRNQGIARPHVHEILGFNFRMTELQAALGLVQLDKLERNTARRRALAARYEAGLADTGIGLPVTPPGRTHVFHRYPVFVGAGRDQIVARLRAEGIGVEVDHPVSLHRQPYVQERGIGADLPVTDRTAGGSLSLPIYPGLTYAEQDRIVLAVRAAVSGQRLEAPPGSERPVESFLR